LKLRSLIIEEKPDRIVCLNFFAFLFARLAIIFSGSDAGIVVIYQTTIHGTRKEHLLHKFYVSLLRKKDVVIAASVNQVKYTLEHFRIPPDSMHIIYNGIDLDFWGLPGGDWDRCAFRGIYGIPCNAKLIIVAAAFRPEKNHLGAVKALNLLRNDQGKDVYLLLAGDGIMRAPAEALAKELNISEYVKFVGAQKDLRPFYWASDLFSLTSASVETFSVAALEGMCCGLPAVLTDIGGAREMIFEGVNGFLSGSEPESLAKNWEKALETDFSALKIHSMIAEKFDAKLMVQGYKKYFE
jgi:glycosyltransferase involved in cell wall biosynthesis